MSLDSHDVPTAVPVTDALHPLSPPSQPFTQSLSFSQTLSPSHESSSDIKTRGHTGPRAKRRIRKDDETEEERTARRIKNTEAKRAWRERQSEARREAERAANAAAYRRRKEMRRSLETEEERAARRALNTAAKRAWRARRAKESGNEGYTDGGGGHTGEIPLRDAVVGCDGGLSERNLSLYDSQSEVCGRRAMPKYESKVVTEPFTTIPEYCHETMDVPSVLSMDGGDYTNDGADIGIPETYMS